jgi:Condensation domain
MGNPDSALAHAPLAAPETPPAPELAQALGSSERFFVNMRKASPTNLARVVALEGTLPSQRVAWALRQLQVRHPLLRARISQGPRPHFVHNTLENVASLRLHSEARQDDQHWQRVLEARLNTRLPNVARPLLEVTHLVGAQRSELVIVADHVICDGVSMNSLCAELLALCTQVVPRAPREVRPVLDDMLPGFSQWRRSRAFAGSLLRMARVKARRASESRRAAVSTAYVQRELSEAETAALVANARAQHTTVTGALLAAVATTLRASARARPLAISVPVNLRPHLSAHALTPEDLGNYTSVAYLEAVPAGAFWALAGRLKVQLARTVASERLLAAASWIYRSGSLFVQRARTPLAHAMISNSGVVPLQRDYGAFRPVGFYSATSAPMLSADYSFFCNTLHGRLCLNLVFSPQRVSRGEAERVLASVRSLLTSQ